MPARILYKCVYSYSSLKYEYVHHTIARSICDPNGKSMGIHFAFCGQEFNSSDSDEIDSPLKVWCKTCEAHKTDEMHDVLYSYPEYTQANTQYFGQIFTHTPFGDRKPGNYINTCRNKIEFSITERVGQTSKDLSVFVTRNTTTGKLEVTFGGELAEEL